MNFITHPAKRLFKHHLSTESCWCYILPLTRPLDLVMATHSYIQNSKHFLIEARTWRCSHAPRLRAKCRVYTSLLLSAFLFFLIESLLIRTLSLHLKAIVVGDSLGQLTAGVIPIADLVFNILVTLCFCVLSNGVTYRTLERFCKSKHGVSRYLTIRPVARKCKLKKYLSGNKTKESVTLFATQGLLLIVH